MRLYTSFKIQVGNQVNDYKNLKFSVGDKGS